MVDFQPVLTETLKQDSSRHQVWNIESCVQEETCCSSQILKTWRLAQETSEEKLFIKSRQMPAIET